MASDAKFVEHVVDQLDGVGAVTYRKMFGEYAIYVDGKIVALVCDDQVFVKPTPGGREFAGEVVEASPYPGAKACFLVEERLEDREWFSALVKLTAAELPPPKPRAKKAPGKKAMQR